MGIGAVKRDRSPYWYAWFSVPWKKTPEKKSTGIRIDSDENSEAQAIQWAISMQQAAFGASKESLPAQQARKYLERIQEMFPVSEHASISNTHLCEQWIKNKKHDLKASSLSKYKKAKDDWLEHLKGRKMMPANTVTIQMFESFKYELLDQGLAPSSVNFKLKTISECYRYAVDLKYLEKNPVDGYKPAKKAKGVDKRQVFTFE